MADQMGARMLVLLAALLGCFENPAATVEDYEQAFSLQQTLALTDDELPPALRPLVREMKALLKAPASKFVLGLQLTLENRQATSDDLRRALHRQHELGVSDDDLPLPILAVVKQVRWLLAHDGQMH